MLVDRAIDACQTLGLDSRRDAGVGYRYSHAALLISRCEAHLFPALTVDKMHAGGSKLGACLSIIECALKQNVPVAETVGA